jgi:hypothetical protein
MTNFLLWNVILNTFQVTQGRKFVGCAKDLRHGKFINLLHFGTELWENELVWHTGIQKIFTCAHYNVLNHFCLYFSHLIKGSWLSTDWPYFKCLVSVLSHSKSVDIATQRHMWICLKQDLCSHWRMLLNLDQIFGAQETNFPPWQVTSRVCKPIFVQ